MPDFMIPENVPEVVALPKAFVEGGPPEQLHGAQIDYIVRGGEYPALKAASLAMQTSWDDAASLNEFRANPDDEMRAASHDRTVREKVEAAQKAHHQRLGAAETGLKAELARVTAELDSKAGLKAVPHYFDSITSAFFSMKPGQRAETIGELIEQGDHASLATLIEAPLFLTGLRAEERDTIKTRVLAKVDPEGLALRDHLAKSLQKVVSASCAALPMWDNLKSGTEKGAWKERAKQAWLNNRRNGH